MADETYLSEALVTFLVEVAQEKNVPKIKPKKKQCCAKFLSFFEAFNLRKFAADLETFAEEHIQMSEDESTSNFVRLRELAFVSELKLGCLRVLDWLFTFEIEECQKFIAVGEKALDKALASVSHLRIDNSSSLSSDQSSARPLPKRPRKRRKTLERRATIFELPDDPEGETETQDHAEGIPEVYRGESENEESRSEELARSRVADGSVVHPDDPEPSILPDVELEEQGGFLEEDDDFDRDSRLESLSDMESSVRSVSRRPRRRRGIDNHIQLSDYVMKKRMLGSSKLSITVDEHRDQISRLVSKGMSARDLLVGVSLNRGPTFNRMIMRSFKQSLMGARKINPMVEEQGFEMVDDEDQTVHGFIEPADDRERTPPRRSSLHDGTVKPLDEEALTYQALEGSETHSGESHNEMDFSDGEAFEAHHRLEVSSQLDFENKLELVHSMVLRAASRLYQRDNIRLRYACLRDVTHSVSENEAPTLFKCLLILAESGRLYIKQTSPESGHIVIFPRGQAEEQVPHV